jgi:transposase
MVRKINTALDLSWLRSELAPHYSSMGRPSIDPELMIRMLVGYVFAIRSERLICREVQVNLAYRWFCKLGIEDTIPDLSAFSRARNERFREGDVFVAYSNGSSRRASRPVWSVAKVLQPTRA